MYVISCIPCLCSCVTKLPLDAVVQWRAFCNCRCGFLRTCASSTAPLGYANVSNGSDWFKSAPCSIGHAQPQSLPSCRSSLSCLQFRSRLYRLRFCCMHACSNADVIPVRTTILGTPLAFNSRNAKAHGARHQVWLADTGEVARG